MSGKKEKEEEYWRQAAARSKEEQRKKDVAADRARRATARRKEELASQARRISAGIAAQRARPNLGEQRGPVIPDLRPPGLSSRGWLDRMPPQSWIKFAAKQNLTKEDYLKTTSKPYDEPSHKAWAGKEWDKRTRPAQPKRKRKPAGHARHAREITAADRHAAVPPRVGSSGLLGTEQRAKPPEATHSSSSSAPASTPMQDARRGGPSPPGPSARPLVSAPSPPGPRPPGPSAPSPPVVVQGLGQGAPQGSAPSNADLLRQNNQVPKSPTRNPPVRGRRERPISLSSQAYGPPVLGKRERPISISSSVEPSRGRMASLEDASEAEPQSDIEPPEFATPKKKPRRSKRHRPTVDYNPDTPEFLRPAGQSQQYAWTQAELRDEARRQKTALSGHPPPARSSSATETDPSLSTTVSDVRGVGVSRLSLTRSRSPGGTAFVPPDQRSLSRSGGRSPPRDTLSAEPPLYSPDEADSSEERGRSRSSPAGIGPAQNWTEAAIEHDILHGNRANKKRAVTEALKRARALDKTFVSGRWLKLLAPDFMTAAEAKSLFKKASAPASVFSRPATPASTSRTPPTPPTDTGLHTLSSASSASEMSSDETSEVDPHSMRGETHWTENEIQKHMTGDNPFMRATASTEALRRTNATGQHMEFKSEKWLKMLVYLQNQGNLKFTASQEQKARKEYRKHVDNVERQKQMGLAVMSQLHAATGGTAAARAAWAPMPGSGYPPAHSRGHSASRSKPTQPTQDDEKSAPSVVPPPARRPARPAQPTQPTPTRTRPTQPTQPSTSFVTPRKAFRV